MNQLYIYKATVAETEGKCAQYDPIENTIRINKNITIKHLLEIMKKVQDRIFISSFN